MKTHFPPKVAGDIQTEMIPVAKYLSYLIPPKKKIGKEFHKMPRFAG